MELTEKILKQRLHYEDGVLRWVKNGPKMKKGNYEFQHQGEMDMINFVEDTRALKMVRQFHRKRIMRFLKGQQCKGLEDQTDLQRSKSIIFAINDKVGK